MARAQPSSGLAQRPRRAALHGSSLIEVLLAIWLVGSAALGAVGLQLWVARSEQSAQWQRHAVSLADAVAETVRGGTSLGAAESAWRARVAQALPEGRLTALAKGSGIALVTVRWTEAAGWGNGPAHLHPDCPAAAEGRLARCVWLAVAQ